MNTITVSFHSSERFRTSAQQTHPVTAKSYQLSRKSNALIQMWAYSEIMKCSSYKCVSWYWYTGNSPHRNPRCECISNDSTVHVVLLRHHGVPVHAVFNITYWTLLTLMPWQLFGTWVTLGVRNSS